MLYCFDIDGTLIRSFLLGDRSRSAAMMEAIAPGADGLRDFEHVCPQCGAEGTLEIRLGDSQWHCEMCPWHGDEADAVYDRVEVLQGRLERVETLALQPGSRFALVTNQAGVAFGYQTADRVWMKVARVIAEFEFFWQRPFTVHVAMHHPNATVDEYRCIEGDDEYIRRKPGPGMLRDAMAAHRVDTATTWFVGDMESDRLAAVAAGVMYHDAEEFFR